MNRFIKTWLLWLLMLALPAQAQISVAQLSCDIGHQRQSGGHAVKTGAAFAKAAPRLKRQTAAVGQHGAKQFKKASKAPAPQADHSACGPCATCCGATLGLPKLDGIAASFELPRQYPPLLPASHVGFIPEGLERPPRLHSV